MLLLQTFNKTPRRRETIGEGKPKENLMEDLRARWPQPRAQASGASVPAPKHRFPGVSPWSVRNAASVCTLIRRQTNGHAGLLSLFSVACLPCIVTKTTKGFSFPKFSHPVHDQFFPQGSWEVISIFLFFKKQETSYEYNLEQKHGLA